MFKQIKKELIQNPDIIINILETYGFCNPCMRGNEIRCGLAEGHNSTAIRIKLVNNDNLFVTDYVRGISYDLFNYILKVKKVEFIELLKNIKALLGISEFYDLDVRYSVFGGFYDKIKKHNDEIYVKTYPEILLSQYENVYNSRFLKDGITYGSQDKFEIGYDLVTQRITIPIRNEYGELIGVKGRANWELSEDELKYLYLVPCVASTTLYGYCQNFCHLIDGDILVYEAEKSVMQCNSFDVYNCVGLGSNSISPKQCKLLMEAAPKRVIFMLDKGLNIEATKRNAKILSAYTQMFDTQIWWWNWTNSSLPDKSSPCDHGYQAFKNILDNELEEVIF